jgi:hypothetical protein
MSTGGSAPNVDRDTIMDAIMDAVEADLNNTDWTQLLDAE